MRPRPTNLVFNILAQNEKIWVLPRSYYFSPYIEVASYTLLTNSYDLHEYSSQLKLSERGFSP